MNEHIMQFFAHAHLPPHLAEVSKPFADLAQQIVDTLPRNPERTVALRKLLEAKDAAVRAKMAKDPPRELVGADGEVARVARHPDDGTVKR